ncbi:MAG: SPOR domain-containing protein [Sphingomonas sp.]|uniref:SPOR domain-containing protein n=1 Tax=Sphingomonas sp. TaxID=28214 RepID=UPI001AD5B3E2|nr:SPOR domain-containing protein [Sphingomonas sp.]MBN8807407.1 SPOR domain-containing protein [Sphingomonas sp.]
MPSNNRMWVAALAVLVAGSAAAQTAPRPDDARDGPPPSTGPSATSDRGADRLDEVGYAAVATDAPATYVAKLRGIPAGGYAEVTMLDSGRTTLVRSDGEDAPVGTLAWLSPAAAAAIGLEGRGAVRIRRVTPSPADQNALANGRPPSPRLDAPAALLAGLRTRLPAKPVAATTRSGKGAKAVVAPTPSARPALASARPPMVRKPAAAPSPPPTANAHLYVQLAAFSTADRANALARSIGGSVSPAGALYRVRTGPYVTAAQAARARDAAVKRGYAQARVVRDN